MADYKQTTIAGSSYTRAVRVMMENPLNGVPSATFAEEEVININEGSEPIKRLVSNLHIPFSQGESFPLRDVVSGDVLLDSSGNPIIGSQDQLYTLLYSAYWYYAEKRDAEQNINNSVPPVTEEPPIIP